MSILQNKSYSRSRIFIFLLLILILNCGCSRETMDRDYDSEIIEDEMKIVSSSSGWKDYKDIDNDSGVSAYEYGESYIRVEFISGGIYLYTYESAGKNDVENMKELADQGDGLNAYINRNVRDDYESKE